MPKGRSLIGETHGRLTVISERQSPDKKYVICECSCSCGGSTTSTRRHDIASGKIQSCGCLRLERLREAAAARLDPNCISKTREYHMHARAKNRAKEKGLEFDIDVSDIIIPDICPLLEIPIILTSDKTDPHNPSLDRRDSRYGYIKGNVWVISKRANTLKNNADLETHQRLTQNMELHGLP